MNSPEIDLKKVHKSEETEALVLKLSLGSELVPYHLLGSH